MGFRFRRSVKILPWVRLNLSKSGVSLTLGPQGANVNISQRGIRNTFGLPGTGLSYVKEMPFNGLLGGNDSPDKPSQPDLAVNDHPIAQAYQQLANGHPQAALDLLNNDTQEADAAFLAGILALQLGLFDASAQYLKAAYNHKTELGNALKQAGVDGSINLPITDEISVELEANEAGVLLAWAELYQQQDQTENAIQTLQHLRSIAPDDPITKLSLAELLSDSNQWNAIVELIGAVENDSYIETALLLYKGMALRELGLLDAALDCLGDALRRKKDRPQELLLAAQYQRGLVYEAKGDAKTARKDFEAVYADDPTYEDVKQKLGLA